MIEILGAEDRSVFSIVKTKKARDVGEFQMFDCIG